MLQSLETTLPQTRQRAVVGALDGGCAVGIEDETDLAEVVAVVKLSLEVSRGALDVPVVSEVLLDFDSELAGSDEIHEAFRRLLRLGGRFVATFGLVFFQWVFIRWVVLTHKDAIRSCKHIFEFTD